jgi:protein-S-isoprenylcysteine O-methyltransferase Ste14
LGLLLRGWAAGHLSKNQRLAMSGPYAYTRNPLYLGTALVAAGLVAASRSWWLGALFAAVFVFIYLPAIQLEQQHLSNLFPEYREYAARVPMLWPKLGGAERGQGFDFALYGRNREYQALYGFLAGAAYLIWKAVSAA